MTDSPDRLEREIDRFFSESILPMHARLKAGHQTLIDTELQRGADSYFLHRRVTRMSRADFESGGIASPASAQADLRRACERSGAEVLAALVPASAALACALRAVQQESAEVSEFVYAMY